MQVTRQETIFIKATRERYRSIINWVENGDERALCFHDNITGLDVNFMVLPSQPSEKERPSSDVANRSLPVDVGVVSDQQFDDIHLILEVLQVDSVYSDPPHLPDIDAVMLNVLRVLGLKYKPGGKEG